MTRLLVLATVALSSFAVAQPPRVEKAQDRRQTADDQLDATRAVQLLRDYDAAAAAGNMTGLAAIDRAFDNHIAREIRESQFEQGQKNREFRDDRRLKMRAMHSVNGSRETGSSRFRPSSVAWPIASTRRQ